MLSRTSARTGSQLSFLIKIFLSLLCVIWLSVTFTILNSSVQVQLRTFGSKELLRNKIDSKHISSHNISPTFSKPKATILSRDPFIKVISDVRGNLGPASVIIQDPPGNDWIKDRWQAAGDMHGTSIPGQHWVVLDFGTNTSRHMTKVVIDWEAAYSKDYRVEISEGNSDSDWCILYDGTNKSQESSRSVEEYGQSPGVKKKTPLHVLHTIDVDGTQENCPSFRFLRVFINKSPTGWGVSIWELDIYGWLLNN
jgi:hypothetical protein